MASLPWAAAAKIGEESPWERPRATVVASPPPLPTVPELRQRLSKGELRVNKKEFLQRVLHKTEEKAIALRHAEEILSRKAKESTSSSATPESLLTPQMMRKSVIQALKQSEQSMGDTMKYITGGYEMYDSIPVPKAKKRPKFGEVKYTGPLPPTLATQKQEARYSLSELQVERERARKDGDQDKEAWFQERIRMARRGKEGPDGKFMMPEPPPNQYHQKVKDLLDKLPSDVQTSMKRNLPDHEWAKLGQTWELVRQFDREGQNGFLQELEKQVREKMT